MTTEQIKNDSVGEMYRNYSGGSPDELTKRAFYAGAAAIVMKVAMTRGDESGGYIWIQNVWDELDDYGKTVCAGRR